jgi:hypothetical protein
MKTAIASSVQVIWERPYAHERVECKSRLAGMRGMLRAVLDGAHKSALRAIANGSASEEHAAAVRNLAVAGLVQPVDGAWTLTQTGHAVLDLEGAGGGALSGRPGSGSGGVEDLKTKIRDWFMT